MARFVAGGRTGAGSTSLPIISVYGATDCGPKVVEMGVSNTTSTAVALKVCKLTTAGTQGSGLTETSFDLHNITAKCTAVNTHSSTGPTVVDAGFYVTIPGQVGAGWIWTFGDGGIQVPAGTANGVGLIVQTGSGQVLDAYIVWDE